MNEKRTEQLNIRISQSLKQTLEKQANICDWAPTKLAEKILIEWANEANNGNKSATDFLRK